MFNIIVYSNYLTHLQKKEINKASEMHITYLTPFLRVKIFLSKTLHLK